MDESIILEAKLLKIFILINKKEKRKTERLLNFYEEHGI